MAVSLCRIVIVNLEDSEVLSAVFFLKDLPLVDQEFLREQSETRIFRVQTGASKLSQRGSSAPACKVGRNVYLHPLLMKLQSTL